MHDLGDHPDISARKPLITNETVVVWDDPNVIGDTFLQPANWVTRVMFSVARVRQSFCPQGVPPYRTAAPAFLCTGIWPRPPLYRTSAPPLYRTPSPLKHVQTCLTWISLYRDPTGHIQTCPLLSMYAWQAGVWHPTGMLSCYYPCQ